MGLSHRGPESLTPPKAEYISADQLRPFIFRLQLDGSDPGDRVAWHSADPHRFRTKRQLWTYSGLGIETQPAPITGVSMGSCNEGRNPAPFAD